LELSDLTDVGI